MKNDSDLRIGVAGLGTIGQVLAHALDHGIPGCKLAAVSGRDPAKTANFISGLVQAIPAVKLIRWSKAYWKYGSMHTMRQNQTTPLG